MKLADEPLVHELIALAQREDLGGGDRTATLLSDGEERARFRLLAKQGCVFAGREIGGAIAERYGVDVEWAPGAIDGRRITDVPTELGNVSGTLSNVLAGERVILNFLQRLCGVASLTRAFVDAVSGTGAVILDTRKTIPGWRLLDKYAVRCGGGCNHRQGLFDAVLIKDNHLSGVPTRRLAGHVFELLNRLAAEGGVRPAFVEVEATTVAQVEALLDVVGIDMILLDNFKRDDLRAAVGVRDERGLRGRIALEASGGVTLETVRAVAETRVERISVGALTHSAAAIDLSLERVE